MLLIMLRLNNVDSEAGVLLERKISCKLGKETNTEYAIDGM